MLAVWSIALGGCSTERGQEGEADTNASRGIDAVSDAGTVDAWSPVANISSERGDLRVIVHSDASPIPVNQMHRWRVQVLRDSDPPTPVLPKALVVNGGMPSHGHGLPTQPTVSHYLGRGAFVVEGMRFHMGGPWEMVIRVLDGNRWHRAVFPIELGPGEGEGHTGHGDRHEPTTWSASEMALLEGLSLSASTERPRDDTNRVQDHPTAIELGRMLFFDENLSANGKVSCATCHEESRAFTDGRRAAKGLTELDRNTPSLIGAVRQRWFYWDGRRDSLWAQALVPIEAPGEMGSSRLAVVRRIRAHPEYRRAYEALFGTLPSLEVTKVRHAGPIGAEAHRRAWRELPVRTRRAISEAFANVGKAIAAFESTLDFEPTRFDHYVEAGAEGAMLSETEVAGLRLFIDPKNQCLRCHNGPTLSNGGFHNIGTGSSDPARPDLGRIAGLPSVLLDEFNCQGRFSDAPHRCDELEHLSPEAHLAGAFKVPSLRGVADTAPYMHDGRFATLREVLEFYRSPPRKSGSMPHELVALPHLSDADLANMEAFLRTLGR